ncbi:hypothetical protein Poly21_17890 [Allorhodopirellula heiligendammensis]|uniref:Uncharacterized protein n=1 Tax=Allorhodopirellula heiligendammensis TaxID=2714739 RepID=A0A5C6C8G4_9BACT|nr:hypothetical protein Poly21_17890 [Allorhodopirellula heiligendammensis]
MLGLLMNLGRGFHHTLIELSFVFFDGSGMFSDRLPELLTPCFTRSKIYGAL